MKQLKIWSMMMLMVIAMPLMVACGSDDDDSEVDINSYIIGDWHSIYGDVFANGTKKTIDITKTGEYSSSYFEMTFNKDKSVLLGHWKQDSNGLSRWLVEKCSYSIKGNIVTMIDNDGESADLLFDSRQRSLCLHGNLTVNGVIVTVNIYAIK